MDAAEEGKCNFLTKRFYVQLGRALATSLFSEIGETEEFKAKILGGVHKRSKEQVSWKSSLKKEKRGHRRSKSTGLLLQEKQLYFVIQVL